MLGPQPAMEAALEAGTYHHPTTVNGDASAPMDPRWSESQVQPLSNERDRVFWSEAPLSNDGDSVFH